MLGDSMFQNIAYGKNTLNRETPDLALLMTEEKQQRCGTFCSSFACSRNSGSRFGKLVSIGVDYKDRCPACKSSDFLLHKKVTPKQEKHFYAQ